ncbi:MAG: hypothetical protein AB8F95_10085 [Bacteroidia bacterium]
MKKNYNYFSLIMGLIFVGFGIGMFFHPPEPIANMGKYAPMLVGVILLMYGTLRISRALKMLKPK